MGLMKLATYYRTRGAEVRFFKGDMRDLLAELSLEDLLPILKEDYPVVDWLDYYPTLFKFLKSGSYATLDDLLVYEDENLMDFRNIVKTSCFLL